MASTRDAQRFRKIYGFHRPLPKPEVMAAGGGADLNGLDWKESVRVTSTINVNISSMGLSPSIDGVALSNGDRVLLKNQSDSKENGLYYYDSVTSSLIRTSDGVNPNLTSAAAVFTEEGSVNGECAFVLTTNDPIAVGSTGLVWIKFAGAGSSIFVSHTTPVNEAKTIYGVSIDTTSRWPSDIGSDVFFYVSGSISGSGAEDKRSVFGGDVVISGSLRQGDSVNALGGYSHAEGKGTIASGDISHVEGFDNISSGVASHAEGTGTRTFGEASHAEGKETISSGLYSHAEGKKTLTIKKYNSGSYHYSISTGFSGYDVTEIIDLSGSLGDWTTEYNVGDSIFLLDSQGVLAETDFFSITAVSYDSGGNITTLTGSTYNYFVQPSWALDVYPNVLVVDSTGNIGSYSTGLAAHAEGSETKTVGDFSHAEGLRSLSIGFASHAEGSGSFASGSYSHSEGQATFAVGAGSHAEGSFTSASGAGSHAEGDMSQAEGTSSHAEGTGTRTIGASSHAEGDTTVAHGIASHAEGHWTDAYGYGSHAGGTFTIASGNFQTVIGAYNKRDNDFSLFVIGDGTGDSDVDRSDILRVNSGSTGGQGCVEVTGTIASTMGFSGSLTQLVDGTSYLIAGTNITIASASNGSITISSTGGGAGSSYFDSTTNGSIFTTGSAAFRGGESSIDSPSDKGTDVFFYVSGSINGAGSEDKKAVFGGDLVISGSLKQGDATATRGNWSHAEGRGTITDTNAHYSHAEGQYTSTEGIGSHAEGHYTSTEGTGSHSEGHFTYAPGNFSHAEGGSSGFFIDVYPGPYGEYSHTEGFNTIAFGEASHAEGLGTITSGAYSHTEGYGTIASGSYQHVGGKYNKRGNDFSLFVIGDGTGDSDANRSDILRVNSGSTGGQGRVEITGSFASTLGMSGSLTRLVDGTSYLVAGSNVTITSASNGSVTISSDTGPQYWTSATAGLISTSGSVSIQGDLTVNGTTVTVNTTNLEVKDSVIGLGFSSGTIAQTVNDRGMIAGLAGSDNAAFLWKNSASEFVLGRTTSSATGSLPITLTGYSNLHVANVQASIVTASQGFSGSLTKLADGTSYLIAGTGTSISTGSNGAVTVSSTVPSYWFSTASPNMIYTTGSVQITGSLYVSNGITGNQITGSYTKILEELSVNADVMEVSGTLTVSGSLLVSGTLTVASPGGLSGSLTRLSDGTSYLKEGVGTSIVTGSNGSITIGVKDSIVATVSGTTFTGVTKHNAGLSGSLTKLVDGTSYLVAGSNVTIASSSNGSITVSSNVNPIYFDSTSAGSIFTTGSVAIRGGESSVDAPSDKGTDVFFYVSGSIKGDAPNDKKSVFGGDLVISGSLRQGSDNNSSGLYSHAEGEANTASGYSSHAEGDSNTVTGAYSHAEGYNNAVAGNWSHAEGEGNAIALTAGDSHVEGLNNVVSGSASHAEGYNNTVTGQYSHAEGENNSASGNSSHAEGERTTTIGYGSHTEGYYTIASGSYQHVGGKYNKRGNDFSLFVIGDGTGDSDSLRSDIMRVNGGLTGGQGRIEVTGSLISTLGISGSLTKLSDGTSYLIAGTNVTITSASNGSVTISSTGGGGGGSTYFDSTTAGSIFTTGSAAFRGGQGSIDSPIDIGTDVFFYVSGSSGSMGTAIPGVAAFGGDVSVTGSLKVGNNSILITDNFVQFGGPGVKVSRSTNDLKFYDLNTPAGVSLTDLISGSLGRGVYVQGFVNADLSGGILTVNHDLGSKYVNAVVYDNSDVQLMPDLVTATSDSILSVDLTSFGTIAGTWHVVVLSSASDDIWTVVSGTTSGPPLVGSVWSVQPYDQVVVFTNNNITGSLPSGAKVGSHIIFKDGTGAAGGIPGPQMISSSFGKIDGTSTYTLPAVNYSSLTAVKVNDSPETWIVV